MPDTTFASLLRSARAEAGLTQKEASALLNIPKRTIEDWEGDRRHPNNFTADAVIKALKEAKK